MGKGHGSLRRAVKLSAFVALLGLVLSVPGIAFAANTASFSSTAPKSGSDITATKPLIAVTVYDKYGVTGTHYWLKLDGSKVAVKLTRIGSGYNRFKLSYQVTNDLSIGEHTIIARVTDRRSKTSTYTWKFDVEDATPPVTTSDAVLNYTGLAVISLHASDNIGVAGTYYKLDGGTQTPYSAPISVPAATVSTGHTLEFWSVDAEGNVEAHNMAFFFVQVPKKTIAESHQLPELFCADSGCHDTDLPSIHEGNCYMCHVVGQTPISTCTTCHGAQGPHDEHASIPSSSDPACTTSGCHGNNVTTIHDTCAVCHASTNAVVKAAVHDGDATCETCHGVTGGAALPNHATGTIHALPASTCFTPECHPSDAALIHTSWANPPGCAACHDNPNHEPSFVCSDCHSNIGTVHGFAHVNAGGTKSTACTACHGTDLPKVHETVGCICHTASYLVGEMGPLLTAGKAECVDCHKDKYAAHGFDQNASGHSTSTYGFRGMREFFDGTDDGVVVNDTRGNPIQGEWAIPSARVFWTPGATNTPEGAFVGADGEGLTSQSEITCRDCHAGLPLETGDPHGAQTIANAGIDPNYPVPYKNAVLSHYQTNVQTFSDGTTAALLPAKSGINYRTTWETTSTADLRNGDDDVICAKCHDLFEENAAGTASADASSAAFFGFGNFVHEEHSRFNALGRGDCVNCHAAIPHGWNRPRLLIQSYSGVATQTAGGVVTTVAVTADAYPYSAPRGYYAAGQPLGGFGSFFPGMEGKRQGLSLLPAIWSDEATPPAGYEAGGPGDHPAVDIPAIGEMTSGFVAPEWQESSSACQAGCGGSLTRHPKTVQGSFIK